MTGVRYLMKKLNYRLATDSLARLGRAQHLRKASRSSGKEWRAREGSDRRPTEHATSTMPGNAPAGQQCAIRPKLKSYCTNCRHENRQQRAELPLAVQGFELLEEGLQPRLSEDLPLGHSTSHCRGLAVPARDIGNDYIPAPGRSREGSARTGDMSHMRTPPHPRKDFAGSQAAQGQPMLPRGLPIVST